MQMQRVNVYKEGVMRGNDRSLAMMSTKDDTFK